MNVIIPIGGHGNRFFVEYDLPKPLIEVVKGTPMVVAVIKNLCLESDDTLYIAYQESWDQYYFQNTVLENFPNIDIRFVVLNGPTIGAPDTLRKVLLTMSDDDLKLPVVSVDVDAIYREGELDILKKRALDQNAVLYFVTDEPRPLYSYVSLNNNKVTEIAEKIQISSNACSGAYKFATGDMLLKHINSMYDVEKTSNEKYTSAVYNQLLASNIPVYGYQISGIDCIGTPDQLMEYQRKHGGEV